MAKKSEIIVDRSEHWFTLNHWKVPLITSEQLVSILTDEDIAHMQQKKLSNKREWYEKLKPAWFEYAPESAKEKWEEYKNTDKFEKLQWMYDNISYNPDATINILKLNKTFCEDISWQNKSFTWEQAQELEKTNTGWYKLMSDYNDCDTDKKEQTDWYKLINIFSNGNGDTVEGMQLFRDMAWCNYRYWTATPYKDKNWVEVKGVARSRKLDTHNCRRGWSSANDGSLVCGLKDSL